MNLWISVLKLLIMDFGYSKLTYSYVIVEEKFTGVWVVVFSCTRPCWVWVVWMLKISALMGRVSIHEMVGWTRAGFV
jgi:hypothetical protein